MDFVTLFAGGARRRFPAAFLLAGGVLASTSGPSSAASPATALPPVTVDVAAPSLASPPGATSLDEADLASKRMGASDTASLLDGIPGVNVVGAGGFSSLPSIHGMADDRLKTLINGMPIISACPNHMNPAMSYIDPSNVGKVSAWTGITPVSAGGDSIGGTIEVESPRPVFANPGEKVRAAGSLSSDYRSASRGIGVSGKASLANDGYSIAYAGSWARAGDTHSGGSNGPVSTSMFQVEDHTATLARRGNGDLAVIEGGWHFSPYEGFPNQRMDMTENNSKFINGHYERDFNWGKLDARGYWRETSHEMNFIDRVKGGDMPMLTEAADFGYSVKADITLSGRDTARVGNEFHRHLLEDWWPPISATASGAMSPYDFFNIHDGERNRMGTFVEWEAKWDPRWTTLLGARNDTVWMDTGNVQGYSDNAAAKYATDAALFNAKEHMKTDINFDLTALARFEPNRTSAYEAGYARKTRSPSLYERYAWSSGSMASNMNNWFGDGNGYVGDIDLSPEIAHTISLTGDWHDGERKLWGLRATPYYTFVQDYIDATRQPGFTSTTNFGQLRLINDDASLYGADLSGNLELWDRSDAGRGVLKASLGWVNGENHSTGDYLYNIMPLNFGVSLDHRLGEWTNTVELKGASSKTAVSRNRNEMQTPGYAVVNLRTGYEWENVSARLGIENLFDHRYYHPLGGAYYAGSRAWGNTVPAQGRSYMAGMTVKF